MRLKTHMIKLHMARKSLDQYSIGPRGVEGQSIERANWICRGRDADKGNLVQSKKPMS